MSFKRAFSDFISNTPILEEAIVDATDASWAGPGNGYSVELFRNGKWRTLPNKQIGNRYDSPGIIISIPVLSEEEYDEEHGHFFENAIDELLAKFEKEVEALGD